MANTLTVNPKTIEKMLKRLDELTSDVKALKAKLLEEEEPSYGSDAWWEWSMKKSEEDYAKGNYVSFDTAEELQKHLDSLK